MKAVYKQLVDKSVAAALAAIEVYNKPDFRYREESFVILLVNAWELLLKAKILKDSKNRLSILYIKYGKNNRKIKRSRTGNPLTIELFGAMQKLALDPVVTENLSSLVDIRDTAVHFYNDDNVRYVVFTLGVAALRNYQHLAKEWFKKNLASYHFYILPIGFSHTFQTFRLIDVESTPPAVATLLKGVAAVQERTKTDGPYFFACEITTELKSAKKFADPADMTVKVDPNAKDAVGWHAQRLCDGRGMLRERSSLAIDPNQYPNRHYFPVPRAVLPRPQAHHRTPFEDSGTCHPSHPVLH